jgi:hypothetical protein
MDMHGATLDIDDDILQAAKELAEAEGKTHGQVLSEFVRKVLGRQRSLRSEERLLCAAQAGRLRHERTGGETAGGGGRGGSRPKGGY